MNKIIMMSINKELTSQVVEKISRDLNEAPGEIIISLTEITHFLYEKTRLYLARSEHPDVLVSLIHYMPVININEDNIESLLLRLKKTNPHADINSAIVPESTRSFESYLSRIVNIREESALVLMRLGFIVLFKPMKHYLQQRVSQSPSLQYWLSDNQISRTFGPEIKKNSVIKTGIATKLTKRHRIWAWLLLTFIVLIAILFALHSCSDRSQHQVAPTKVVWKDLGRFFKRGLPDGQTLNIPEFGVEGKLLRFINSPSPISNTLWFSFDRLRFETNSSQLQDASKEQLNNIAAIMKAYPHLKMKLAGYTDDTGTDNFNMKLSQERAVSVKSALVNLGVESNRLDAVGYGSINPVMPNTSSENRSENRRLDIQITQK